MRIDPTSRRLAGAVLVAVAGLSTAFTAPAAAGPPTDGNADGYLGFCDTHHEQVRSGLLGAAPFAWTIASSAPAPSGYEKGKAAIIAFQPRKGVDPGDWSGKQLTASSSFSNAKHPMSAGTRIDPALVDFTSTYPPQFDGLVQLRMFFAAPNRPQVNSPYPAVYVRVTGTRWTQVGGGRVDCSAGKARSVELDSLPASRLKVRNPRPAPQGAAALRTQAATASSAAGAPSTTGGSGAQGGSAAATSGVAANRAGGRASSSAEDGGGVGAWIWIPVAVVALAGSAYVVRRRNSSPVVPTTRP